MTSKPSREPDAIAGVIARLRASSTLDSEQARHLRDLAATTLLSQPRDSFRIASALVQEVERASSGAEARATAWRCLAEAQTFLGKLREARLSYETASGFAAEAQSDSLLGEILVGRIGVLTALGDSEGARWIAEADRILERSDNIEYRAKLHMNLGSAAYHREDHQEAHREYGLAHELFAQIDKPDPIVVSLLVNLGIACKELFRFAEARSNLQSAESLASEMEQGHLGSHARLELSLLAVAEGRFRSALELLERVEIEFEEVGAVDLLAMTRMTQAEIHLELGLAPEALRLSEEAALSFREQEKNIDALLAKRTQGLCLKHLRRLRTADRTLAEVGEELLARQIWPRHHQVLLDRAEIALLRGDFERAEDLARKAKRGLTRRRETSVPDPREAIARIRLAQAQSGRGRNKLATRTLMPALDVHGSYPIALRRRLLTEAGRLARLQGDLNRSRELLDEAIADVERQRLLIPGAEFRAAAFEEHSESYRERVLCELEMVGTDRESTNRVFRLWQIARARGFEERMAGADREAPEDLRFARQRLAALTQRAEDRSYAQAPARERAALAAEVVEMERDVLRRHRHWETQSGHVTSIPLAVTIESVQRSLDVGECFLEFFVGSTHIYVLLLQSSSAELRALPVDASTLVQWTRDLVFQIDSFAHIEGSGLANAEFLHAQTEGLLRQLDQALLRPLDDVICGKQLCIIPHRELHLVPFEAVLISRSDSEAPWPEVVVRRISTARQFVARRDRRGERREQTSSSGNGVTLIGNIAGGPLMVGAEIDSIARQLSNRNPKILLDPTADQVRLALRKTHLAHLSTHGSFRDDNPLLSRLSFREGALFLSDLLAERLPCDLVVLSSCQSGCSFSGNGEDLVGLSYGFLSAGVDTLVASLWRVDDAATAALMHAFYEELDRETATEGNELDDFDPARALARARYIVRKRWPHPFYWGAFTLYGG